MSLASLTTSLRKWRALFGVYAQDWLAYKANGIIWVLTDLVTTITMPLVWASAAGHGMIAGYNAADFTVYYLAMLVLGSFITSHIMWELAFEIREGVFTNYLIRPFSFFQTIVIRNLAWRTIRCFLTIPFLAMLVVAYWNLLGNAHVYLGWHLWVATLLGHAVSISVVLMLSMVALFIQEAVAVFEMYYVPQLFLSGYLFPVAVMPEWAGKVALALPFYYTTGLPVDVVVGRVKPEQAVPLIGVQVLWIIGAALATKLLWHRGLRHYTGIGM